MQYSTYKNTLQQLAQKIGDVDQEKEEHKCVVTLPNLVPLPFPQPKPNARRMRLDELDTVTLAHRPMVTVSSPPIR